MFFIIPLMPKSKAPDWAQIGDLLTATLRSLAQQRLQRFEAFIIGHDVPDNVDLSAPNLHWVQADWDGNQPLRAGYDRGTKMRVGMAEVAKRGGGYVMPLDADDLVSDRLVELVYERGEPGGYIMEAGYMIDWGSGAIAPIPGFWPRPFHYYSGSCAVFNFTPDDLPRDRLDDREVCWNKLGSHHRWEREMRWMKRPLTLLHEPLGMYAQNTGVNIHDQRNPDRNRLAREAVAAGALADTAAIRREFGLSAEGARPPA